MTFSIKSLRNDLRTFRMHLDVLNSFNDYDFFKARNTWSLAEVPLMPVSHFDLQEGLTKGISLQDSHNSPGNDAYINMIFAFSPAGFKTAPIFIIYKPFLRGEWFFPLDDTLYNDGARNHPFTSSSWVPRNGSVHCVKTNSLTKGDMSSIISHINKEIRQYTPFSDNVLLIVPEHFPDSVPSFLHICEDNKIQATRYPESAERKLDPFNKTLFTGILKTMQYEERILDLLHFASRNTIQMKIMLGVMGFNGINTFDIITAFESSCLWPLDGRFAEEEFITVNFVDENKENIDTKPAITSNSD